MLDGVTAEVSVDVGTKNSPPSVNTCKFLELIKCLISLILSEVIVTSIASSALPEPISKLKYSATLDPITAAGLSLIPPKYNLLSWNVTA